MINLTPQQLRKAADIQEKILGLQNELNQLLGALAQAPALAAEPTTQARKKVQVQCCRQSQDAGGSKGKMGQDQGHRTLKPHLNRLNGPGRR